MIRGFEGLEEGLEAINYAVRSDSWLRSDLLEIRENQKKMLEQINFLEEKQKELELSIEEMSSEPLHSHVIDIYEPAYAKKINLKY
jgi:hypothetical protein